MPNGGQLLGALSSPRDVGPKWAFLGGWGAMLINKKAVDAYDPTDERRKQLIKVRYESYKGELMDDTMRAADWGLNNQADVGFSTKYWLGNEEGLLSPQNLPMMRFAEVLLNYSEILFMQNKSTEAYNYLNMVRSRANLPDKPGTTDQAAFLADIMAERRFELLFEPNLWFHYTRTGTAAKFLKDVYNIDMLPKWYHLPIPERERSVNPNLCTNGY